MKNDVKRENASVKGVKMAAWRSDLWNADREPISGVTFSYVLQAVHILNLCTSQVGVLSVTHNKCRIYSTFTSSSWVVIS